MHTKKIITQFVRYFILLLPKKYRLQIARALEGIRVVTNGPLSMNELYDPKITLIAKPAWKGPDGIYGLNIAKAPIQWLEYIRSFEKQSSVMRKTGS